MSEHKRLTFWKALFHVVEGVLREIVIRHRKSIPELLVRVKRSIWFHVQKEQARITGALVDGLDRSGGEV